MGYRGWRREGAMLCSPSWTNTDIYIAMIYMELYLQSGDIYCHITHSPSHKNKQAKDKPIKNMRLRVKYSLPHWSLLSNISVHYSLAGQKCCEAWGTFWAKAEQHITTLITQQKEGRRNEAVNVPTSDIGNNLLSARAKLGTVSRATLKGLLTNRMSLYGLFKALQCHVELKLVTSIH